MRPLHLVLTLVLLAGGVAVAQVDLTFGGSARTEFGVGVDGTLPVAAAELELRASGEVGSGLFPDAAFSASLTGRHDAATGSSEVRLGDAYATLYLDDVELTVGRQTVFWGSTDGVNPVDVLNPRDRAFPPDAQKLPVPMVRARYYAMEELRFEAAVIPVFLPSLPPGGAWRPSASPQLPPGAALVGQLPPDDRRPAAELGNMQFGVRATAALEHLDLSATYFHGFRSMPTASATLEPAGAPGAFRLRPVLTYDRVDLIGLDLSGAVQDVILRAEVAYTFSGDPDGTDPGVGNPSLQAVVGGEVLIPGGPRLVVQGVFDRRSPDAGGDADVNFKAMTALNYPLGARTQLELGWLQNLDLSGAVLPRVSYTFADGVVGSAAAYVFYGGDGTEFGDWRANTQLRVSLAYAF